MCYLISRPGGTRWSRSNGWMREAGICQSYTQKVFKLSNFVRLPEFLSFCGALALDGLILRCFVSSLKTQQHKERGNISLKVSVGCVINASYRRKQKKPNGSILTLNHWSELQSPVSAYSPLAAVLCALSSAPSCWVLVPFPTINLWSSHYHNTIIWPQFSPPALVSAPWGHQNSGARTQTDWLNPVKK